MVLPNAGLTAGMVNSSSASVFTEYRNSHTTGHALVGAITQEAHGDHKPEKSDTVTSKVVDEQDASPSFLPTADH